MPSGPSKLNKSPVFWGLILILAYAPYQRGLFFEREWLYTFILTAVLLLLAIFTRNTSLSRQHYQMDWPVLGLLAAYIVSALTAVNAEAADLEVLKLLALAVFYWLAAHGGWNKRDIRILLQGVFLAGVGVALLGLGAALGLVQLNGGYVGGRIYSTLQYPNTLAAYLGMMFLLGIYLWHTAKSWLRYIYPSALSLVVICLIATGSRGGIGVFLLALPVAIWLQPFQVRKPFALQVCLSLGIGALAAWAFLKYLPTQPGISGAVVLAAALLSTCLGLLREPLGRLGSRRLVLMVLLLALGMGLVYTLHEGVNNPLQRLQTASLQQHSFQERLAYYQDGLKMLMHRPLQGYGGGGWALYPRYQSYPYTASDPHSELMKVGVESGFLGLFCYGLWWVFVVRLAWRQIRSGDSMVGVLLGCLILLGVHSLMDFDLSFGAMQLLLWVFSGLIAAGTADPEVRPPVQLVQYISLGVITAIVVILAASGITLQQASEQEGWGTFYTLQSNPTSALQHLQLAAQRNPLSAAYPAAMADLYLHAGQVQDLGKAQSAISKALRRNSTDISIKALASEIYLAKGELDQAAALAEDQLSFATLHEQAYLQLAGFYRQLAEKALSQGRRDQARRFFAEGGLLAARFQARLDQVPPHAAALWIGGKPKVSEQLVKTCAAMTAEAAKLT